MQNFTSTLLSIAPNTKLLASGDFNEFTFVKPLQLFAADSGLQDLDEIVQLPPAERYTYLYEGNCQELDHVFVSEAIANNAATSMEHVHVNTWVAYEQQKSDHDPSIVRVDVCNGERKGLEL